MAKFFHGSPVHTTSTFDKDEKTSPGFPTSSTFHVRYRDSHSDEVQPAIHIGWRSWMAVLAGCSCVGTGFFIGIQVGVYFPFIVAELGGSSQGAWIPNIFELGAAGLAGIVGRVSDVTGRRWILIGGFIMSAIGCIVIATAESTPVVLVGSALLTGLFANQGLFFAIPSEVLPKSYRGEGATLTSLAGGLAAVIALLINGHAVQNNVAGGWRLGWYVAFAMNLIVVALLYFFYDPRLPPNPEGRTTWEVLKHDIDWIGTGLLIAFAVPFMMGLTWGGGRYPWVSTHVLGTMLVGTVSLVGLVIHQVFINKHGIFDHDLFLSRNFFIGAVGLFTEGIVFLAVIVFYPLQTSILWETRVFYQGLRLIPFFLGFALFGPIAGWYTRKYKDMKSPLLAGWTCVLISIAVLSTVGPNGSNTAIGVTLLGGIGFSTPLALLNATAQLAVPGRLLGLATGQLIAARALGAAVGVVILVSVFQAKLTVLLPADIAAAALGAGLPAASLPALVGGIATNDIALASSAEGVTAAVLQAAGAAAAEAYVVSLHYGWYTALAFVVFATITVATLDGKAIRGQMTSDVDRSVEPLSSLLRSET